MTTGDPVLESVDRIIAAGFEDPGDPYGDVPPPDLGAVVVEKPAAPPKFIDWAQFWQRGHIDVDWLVEPLIAAGQSVSIYSPAKTGKSLLTLELAAALATGNATLGNDPSDPINVLYVDHENTEDDLFDRLQCLGYGPDDDLSKLHYSCLADWKPLDTETGGQELTTAAKELAARLVVIDSTARAISGPENEADTIRAFYRCTGRLLKRERIAVLRLDNTGKDTTKGQRGSSAKSDDVDAVWALLARTPTQLTLRRDASRTGHGQDMLFLERRAAPGMPLRHRIENGHESAERLLEQVIDWLDDLALPPDIGRRAAGEALRGAGHAVGTATLGHALKRRKLRTATNGPQDQDHLWTTPQTQDRTDGPERSTSGPQRSRAVHDD
jgi:KaiC/GvpD/RAD55 family RecA-like ATPase